MCDPFSPPPRMAGSRPLEAASDWLVGELPELRKQITFEVEGVETQAWSRGA